MLGRRVFYWTIVSLLGWLILGGLAANNEAHCKASGEWFCFDPKAAFFLVAIPVALLWGIGAIVLAIGTSIEQSARRRRANRA
jgi:hypothetical protein